MDGKSRCGLTYQKQTPSSRHEGKEANKYILNRHVRDSYQYDQNGDKGYEDKPLYQPEHKLKLRTESSPPYRHGLEKQRSRKDS